MWKLISYLKFYLLWKSHYCPADWPKGTWFREGFQAQNYNCLGKSLLCMWAYPVHCSHWVPEHLPPHLWKLDTSLDTVNRHWETEPCRLGINGQKSRAASPPPAVSNGTRAPWVTRLPVQALVLTFTRAYSRRSSMEPFLHSSVWMTFFPPLPWVWIKIKTKR